MKKKTYDVSFIEEMPTMEIEARSEEEAKRIFLEAIKRALDENQIAAVELEIVA